MAGVTCKACWEKGELNENGYCHACIRLATAAATDDVEEFKDMMGIDEVPKDNVELLLDFVLRKQGWNPTSQ